MSEQRARTITTLEFDKALVAMLDAVSAGAGAEPRYRRALLAALDEIDIEVGPGCVCTCSTLVREYCAWAECRGGADFIEPVWVLRTWVDVRAGDTVRPPGSPDNAALVVGIGPALTWHVNDKQPLDDYQRRDIQYNPGRYAGEYSTRRVTLAPAGGSDVASFTRDMKPDAPVEIEVTPEDLSAIELLGGWANRLDPINQTS